MGFSDVGFSDVGFSYVCFSYVGFSDVGFSILCNNGGDWCIISTLCRIFSLELSSVHDVCARQVPESTESHRSLLHVDG